MAARDEGAALIEFCLALPLLLVFFLGLWAFTHYIIESQVLHFSAYIAARTALVETAAKGEQAAAQFLALSRREVSWLTSLSRQARGRVLDVTKGSRGVEVQVGRKETELLSLLSFLRAASSDGGLLGGGLKPKSDQLLIRYRLGRL